MSASSTLVGTPDRHTCHADACDVAVPPKMFMCRELTGDHAPVQKRIWALYVPGQEERKDPSQAYIRAAREAIAYVKEREGL